MIKQIRFLGIAAISLFTLLLALVIISSEPVSAAQDSEAKNETLESIAQIYEEKYEEILKQYHTENTADTETNTVYSTEGKPYRRSAPMVLSDSEASEDFVWTEVVVTNNKYLTTTTEEPEETPALTKTPEQTLKPTAKSTKSSKSSKNTKWDKIDYTEDDLECLAIAIYVEAGGDNDCDECRYRVGDVILNRVTSKHYPNTIRKVLEQRKQYSTFYKTGVVWPKRAKNKNEQHDVERAREVARQLLEGEYHSDLYGKGYVYQAEFIQGRDGFWCDGTYFAKYKG